MKEKVKIALKRRQLKGLKAIKWYLNSGTGYLETVIYDPETKQRHHLHQHRLIWEIYRGPIPEGGIVHHKNGIPTDNRIENLELLPSHGAHISRHRSQEKALGVVTDCPFCHHEFVAFGLKKYCSDRCRSGAAARRYRARYPNRPAEATRRYRAKKTA
jgi:hypothetical protein